MGRFILFLFLVIVSCTLNAQEITYVTENGSGDKSGNSWSNAMPGTKLQDAIGALESSGGEVWVAEGTYVPQKEYSGYIKIDGISLWLLSGVEVYGGFSPDKGIVTMEQRDPEMYQSVLNGDINGDDKETINPLYPEENRDDNLNHVVIASSCDTTAILDGFVITGGNNYSYSPGPTNFSGGGGIYIIAHQNYMGPTIRNCFIKNNIASFGGGAHVLAKCYSYTGNPAKIIFENNHFENNYALVGGGMCIMSWDDYGRGAHSRPILKNNTFVDNEAEFHGGAVYIGGKLRFYSYSHWPDWTSYTSVLQCSVYASLSNNIFSFNKAGYYGGGIIMTGMSTDPCTLNANSNFFIANEAGWGGGCFLFTHTSRGAGQLNAAFFNNIFANNSAVGKDDDAGSGGAVYLKEEASRCDLYAKFVNNTIVNNEAYSGSIVYQEDSYFDLQNTIMWEATEKGKSAYISKKQANTKAAYSIQYCAMQGITETDGNFNLADGNTDADGPNFVLPTSFVGVPETDDEELEIENADWSLSSASPLRGIANKSFFPDSIDTDLAGNTRIVGKLDMGAYENQTTTNISTIESNQPLFCYPNPCQDYLYFDNSNNISEVEIIDQVGKIVYSSNKIERNVNVKKLTPGVYFVRVYGEGVDNDIQKIIKQ